MAEAMRRPSPDGTRPGRTGEGDRLDTTIARRFTALSHAVRVCQPADEGMTRLLCFLTADGKSLGSVRSADLLEAPDATAADLVSS